MNLPPHANRILALDVMRGICIAGMALVNHPGNRSHTYAPLLHAEWNGLTPTDLIFPFFIFIMGISTYISLSKTGFECNHQVVFKILRRTIVIFVIGLALNWFGDFCKFWAKPIEDVAFLPYLWESICTFDHLRIPGVMQRLSLCYGFCALFALTVKHRHIPYLSFLLLAIYAVILIAGNGFAEGDNNILSIIDRNVLTTDHIMNDHGVDPVGALSTLSSVSLVLVGFWVGYLMFGPQDFIEYRDERLRSYLIKLFLIGAIFTFAGFLLSYGCPINKKIWSPTFILISGGFAATFLGLLIWIIDIKSYKYWCGFFQEFGVNPLFMYVFGSMLGKIFQTIHFTFQDQLYSLRNFTYKCLEPVFGDYGSSLAYALIFVIINWIVAYVLYLKKIYIKI